MQFIIDVVQEALELVGDFGPELRRVVVLTLWVSASATLIGVIVGVPLGLVLGLHKFTGRGFIMTISSGWVKRFRQFQKYISSSGCRR